VPSKRQPGPRRPPGNTASPSGPSAPQTTLGVKAQTGACGVPLTVACGNEWLQGGCCDLTVRYSCGSWFLGPNGPSSGPKGQPFSQPGSQALVASTTTPSGPTGQPFQEPRGAARGIVGPLGRQMSWSVLPGPLGRAGRTGGPLGRQTPAARQSRRNARPAQSPLREHRLPERPVSSPDHAQRERQDGRLSCR
jgi:hypothetical protein